MFHFYELLLYIYQVLVISGICVINLCSLLYPRMHRRYEEPYSFMAVVKQSEYKYHIMYIIHFISVCDTPNLIVHPSHLHLISLYLRDIKLSWQ
jgi:hypothetical protein